MDSPTPNRRPSAGLINRSAIPLAIALAVAAVAIGVRQVSQRPADALVGPKGAITPTRPPYDPVRWPTAAAGVPPPPAAVVAHGAALYDAHCASCHGVNLEGQPDWKRTLPDGSLPAPPHDVSGHTWHHGDGELLRIIAEGGVVYMPESKMPGFAEVMSDDDMRAVLTFIKSSWGAEQLAWQAQITAGEVGPQAAP